MPTTVLDSYALLAYFWDGSGADKVETLLTKAALSNRPVHMTEIAFMDVKSIVLRKGGQRAWMQAAEVLTGLPIDFHVISRSLAEGAAELKARVLLSASNALTAALALEKKAEVAAGDSEFKLMEAEIKIVWIGTE